MVPTISPDLNTPTGMWGIIKVQPTQEWTFFGIPPTEVGGSFKFNLLFKGNTRKVGP